MIQNRESTSRVHQGEFIRPGVHACESRVHATLFALAFAAYAYGCAFALWNFLLHAAKKNNNTAKCFVYLKQNNLEGFTGAPYFLSSKRDQI